MPVPLLSHLSTPEREYLGNGAREGALLAPSRAQRN